MTNNCREGKDVEVSGVVTESILCFWTTFWISRRVQSELLVCLSSRMRFNLTDWFVSFQENLRTLRISFMFQRCWTCRWTLTSWGCRATEILKPPEKLDCLTLFFTSLVSVVIQRRCLSFFFSSSCCSHQSGNWSSDGACVMVDGDLRPPTSRVTEKWVHSKVNPQNQHHFSSLFLFCSSCFYTECWPLTSAALRSHPEELPELPHQTQDRNHFSLRHHRGTSSHTHTQRPALSFNEFCSNFSFSLRVDRVSWHLRTPFFSNTGVCVCVCDADNGHRSVSGVGSGGILEDASGGSDGRRLQQSEVRTQTLPHLTSDPSPEPEASIHTAADDQQQHPLRPLYPTVSWSSCRTSRWQVIVAASGRKR